VSEQGGIFLCDPSLRGVDRELGQRASRGGSDNEEGGEEGLHCSSEGKGEGATSEQGTNVEN